jgi:hypothetical protein
MLAVLIVAAPIARAHAAEPAAEPPVLVLPADAGTATPTPASAPPGSSVSVAGVGWVPDSKGYSCELRWMDVTGPQVGDCTVGGDGGLMGQFVVPATAQPGAAEVEVCNAGDDAGCASELLDVRAVHFTVASPSLALPGQQTAAIPPPASTLGQSPVRPRRSARVAPTLKPLADNGSASPSAVGLAIGGVLILLAAGLAGRVVVRRRQRAALQPAQIAVTVQTDPPQVTCDPPGGRDCLRVRVVTASGRTTVTTTTGGRP